MNDSCDICSDGVWNDGDIRTYLFDWEGFTVCSGCIEQASLNHDWSLFDWLKEVRAVSN